MASWFNFEFIKMSSNPKKVNPVEDDEEEEEEDYNEEEEEEEEGDEVRFLIELLIDSLRNCKTKLVH